ncbi:hypothetical protein KP509_03G035200 [Ceratopteris richardii]|nr:hypothetical protein KP509_03G035200 [Ceratopteris richardii]
MDTVHGYYRRISRQGIWVGLRHYMFFAFKDPKGKKKQCRPGEEMLSVPKCFFVCTESLAKWDLVHAKFHHFQSIHEAQSYLMHIQTVTTNAKKISRLQLSLSQTLPILNLDSTDVNVEIIEDVYCRDKYGDIICDASGKSLIHTDGTGFISQDIAARCPSSVCKGSAKTRLSDGDHPLLLQVRVFREGMVAKGTLLVNLKLPPATIQLRKSMVKVTTDKMIVGPSYNSLEVCGTSRKPGKAKLSPYVALLLIYGGVPESTIMRFAEEELEEIVTTVKNRAAAISAMYSDMGDVCALRMLLANIPMDEPFLRKTLLDMTKSKLLDLSRGRVTIPDTYNFMGSADPTGRLERNQVVILLEHGPLYCPKVLVYKSPGLHVGDVKVFEATWHEDFKDIVGNGKYVIFFSVKGERSVVDEIANSDLDGDQYWCCWNSLIVKEFKPSDVWKNNDTVNKCPGNDEACIKDFRTIHFEAFLRARFKPSQTMGVAANSWQAHMDKYLMLDGNDPEKARLWHVIGQLVDTYYEAVDADKTGKQVSVHDSCRAREWPHYMEKEKEHGNKWIKKDVSYHSTTILGKIYDLVKGESITKDFVKNLESKVVEGSFVNKLFKYPGYEEYVSEWDKKFTSFRCKMAQLLRCKDFDNPNSEIESLFEEYKWELYKAETLIDSPEPIEVVLRKASAIYAVVYGHSQRRLEAMMEGDTAKTEVNLPLQFAWRVAGFALLKLFRENSEHKRAEPIMMEEEVLRQLKVARRERSRATETE